MAQVELGLGEAYRGELPAVCARCGKPAYVYRNKTLSTLPLGLPFLYLWLIVIHAGKIFVRLPFCSKHRNHFQNHSTLRAVGFMIVLVVGIIGLLALADRTRNPAIAGLLCPLSIVVLLAYLLLCALKRFRGVYLVSYNDQEVVLGGVCAEFAQAVGDKRAEQQRLLSERWADRGGRRPGPESDEHFHA
jgi:hypothetical protein